MPSLAPSLTPSLSPQAAQLTGRLCRRFAATFAAVALGLALLRQLASGWLDGPALGPLTWGQLALLLLYPILCVIVASRELLRRSDGRLHAHGAPCWVPKQPPPP